MSTQQSQYLESKVLTAPPHRLHLMLIESAIRFGRQAEQLLRKGETVTAATPLMRVIDIVGEMLAGVREQKSEINRNLTSLYWFLFRRVTEAKIYADAEKLAEALSLLEYERQTWSAVCEKFGADSKPAAASLSGPKQAARMSSGFSLEA
jgi:flagellar protein FliS